MDTKPLKITYHSEGKKINTYIKKPSPFYNDLKKEIELNLFGERAMPRCEIRIFWIDADGDEIDIFNQCDYEIFMGECAERRHLQIAPMNMTVEKSADIAAKNSEIATDLQSNDSKIPPAAGSDDFSVHSHVECDFCLMCPIVGFRYKCMECPDYDLCQNCESKHIHSEHMMVRIPTNNCETFKRTLGRRAGKRSKKSCPFAKNGLSLDGDDDAEAATSPGTENAEQTSATKSKERHHGRKYHRRHHRNNFFANLYEMMNDLAEGGGASAADHAMNEPSTASNNTKSDTEPQTDKSSTTNTNGFGNKKNPIEAAAAVAAAEVASKHAHETAIKAAEIAAKVAHETAMNMAKNITENMNSTLNPEATAGGAKEATKEKVDATTSPPDPEIQPNAVPVRPTPSLESLAQFLDPQYLKTGIQILNNFSDMFAKMLDPMENADDYQNNSFYSNLGKNPTSSQKTSVSSNFNSMDSEKKSEEESIKNDNEGQEKSKDKQSDSSNSSQVQIDDLGSDSENESVTESFVKLYAPNKENVAPKLATEVSADQTTSQTNAKNVMDYAQLSADLKAHIAQENANDTPKTVESIVESVDKATSTVTASEPAVTTAPIVNSNESNKNEEKRAVPVYHADKRINNAVHAMMSMGFSNEGAWLTQLLESVNGSIPEALDVLSATQRGNSR